MKKYIYAACLFVGSLFMTSCNDTDFLGPKDDIGGTVMEAMAGEWYVTAVAVDDKKELVYSDDELFGMGNFKIKTYNTASNADNLLYIDDNDNFWGFKVVANANLADLSFNCQGVEAYEGCDVTITDGKILYGAGHQNNGSAADSIVFYVKFSDDEYPANYGYDCYQVSGVRYSGLVEND